MDLGRLADDDVDSGRDLSRLVDDYIELGRLVDDDVDGHGEKLCD